MGEFCSLLLAPLKGGPTTFPFRTHRKRAYPYIWLELEAFGVVHLSHK